MNYLKDLHSFLDKNYKLFLPMIVLMAVLLQVLYLFPGNLTFFSINQIFVDFIIIVLIFTLIFSLFSFIFFVGLNFFNGMSRKIFLTVIFIVTIFSIFSNVKVTYITGAFFGIIGGFLSFGLKFNKFEDFAPYVFYYCIIFTPIIIFLNNSFSPVKKVIINDSELSVVYFNTDYFFLSNGDILDKEGNKYLK